MTEFIVEINGRSFYTEDWVSDTRVDYSDFPSMIINTFEDNNETYVVLREPVYEYETMKLDTFIQLVQNGTLTYVAKPKYSITESFKNKFTEKTIEVVAAPYAKNDEGNVYVYYTREWTPTYGYNFKCMTEQEITDFYQAVGGEEG